MPTLLLADDSATIQRVIELTFAGEDITVVAVSDGDQAIARIQSAPPDIVLADIGMPGKTGYEVAEYIKQTPQLAHIPVVLLTGAFEPVDQAKAAAAGCDGVLAKPFEPQIVIGRVKELLGKGGSAAPPAEIVAEPEPQAPSTESRVEDYFDRLDAALATFNPPAAAPPPPAPELDLKKPEVDEAAPQVLAIAEHLAVQPPASILAPEPEPPPTPIKVVAHLEPQEPVEPHEPVEPQEPRVPKSVPSIADAFSAILAAEQNALGVRPEWPTPSSQPQAAAPSAPSAPAEIAITDELIERVARRVLEQMSDRVVKETVTTLASETAERLVREEIERIKAAVK